VQAALLILAAVKFGLHVPFSAALLAIFLVGTIGASFLALSHMAGLMMKSGEALAPRINTLGVPIVLLSDNPPTHDACTLQAAAPA
jgi:hypothetical protein